MKLLWLILALSIWATIAPEADGVRGFSRIRGVRGGSRRRPLLGGGRPASPPRPFNRQGSKTGSKTGTKPKVHGQAAAIDASKIASKVPLKPAAAYVNTASAQTYQAAAPSLAQATKPIKIPRPDSFASKSKFL